MSKYTDTVAQVQSIKTTLTGVASSLPSLQTAAGTINFHLDLDGSISLMLGSNMKLTASDAQALCNFLSSYFN